MFCELRGVGAEGKWQEWECQRDTFTHNKTFCDAPALPSIWLLMYYEKKSVRAVPLPVPLVEALELPIFVERANNAEPHAEYVSIHQRHTRERSPLVEYTHP